MNNKEKTQFEILRIALKKRGEYFNPNNTPIPVGFRFTEFAGEAGEVCNAGKKLMRHELGIVGGSDDIANLREEIGDAFITLELIAQHYDLDMWQCVVEKFNKTSEKLKFPIKLETEETLCC